MRRVWCKGDVECVTWSLYKAKVSSFASSLSIRGAHVVKSFARLIFSRLFGPNIPQPQAQPAPVMDEHTKRGERDAPRAMSFSIDLDSASWSMLKGHRGEVLSLDILGLERAGTGPDASGVVLLASGGEDSTCRVWDVAAGRVVKCYTGMFEDNEGVGAVAFVDASRLLAATSTSIYELDLKVPGVIIRKTTGSLPSVTSDEINQLAVHPRKGSNHVAVADDSGTVTLLDSSFRPPKPVRTLRRPSGNDDLCTCVAFRPRVPYDLACGFHSTCIVGLWDISKGQKGCRAVDVSAAATVEAAKLEDEDDDPTVAPSAASSCQLFNPPYVNSLAFSACGRWVAVGKGNGEVGVYDYAKGGGGEGGGRGGEAVAVLRGGHTTSVASVVFLDVGGGEEGGRGGGKGRMKNGGGREEVAFLASIGNDRVLTLWECSLPSLTGNCSSSSSKSRRQRILKQFTDLPGKPNWMVGTVMMSPSAAGAAAVAVAPAAATSQEGGDGREKEGVTRQSLRLFVAMTTSEIAVLSVGISVQREKHQQPEEWQQHHSQQQQQQEEND